MTAAEIQAIARECNAAMARLRQVPMTPCAKCGKLSRFAGMDPEKLCLECVGVLPLEE